MSDLRELRDRIIAVATGDVMERVDAYVAACEQLAVAAALEQVAQGSRSFLYGCMGYLGISELSDKAVEYISERVRAIIPAEGAELLREHDSQLDSESDAAWEVRAAQRERIARLEGMLEVVNKMAPVNVDTMSFKARLERELALAQAASQEMKK